MSLIGTEGLEGALREILETLQRQSLEVSNLKAELAHRATRGDLHELERRLAQRLQGLDSRVERLEADTAIALPLDVLLEGAGPAAGGSGSGSGSDDTGGAAPTASAAPPLARVPIARYIAAHHSHLRHLHRTLDVAATRSDLEAVRREAGAALSSALAGVADERAPRETVVQLASALSSVQEELSAVQGSVATKVDRSDLGRMAAVAAELSTYAAFKASSGADIRELGLRTEEHRAALDRNLESVAKLSAVVQALAGACAGKAESREVAHVAGGLERLGGEVGRRAGVEDVRALASALAAVSGRAAGLEAGAKEAARAGAEERRGAEARAAAALGGLRSELGSTAAALRAELSGLREEVEARAYVTSLEATDEALAEAEARLDLCHRKTDVALRFVDWYAEKGEAYEYNASSLERHMNSLAVDNRARTVGSMSDMRSKVFGGSAGGGAGASAAAGEALRASFAPAATGVSGGSANASWLGAATSREGPLTGSGGIRLGGTAGT